MAVDAKTFNVLASRVLSDDSLSPAEAELLRRELEQRPERGEEFLANEAVDTYLGCLAHSPPTQDDFVRATLARVAAAKVRRQDEKSQLLSVRAAWTIAAACLAAGLLVSVSVWLLSGRWQIARDEKPGEVPENRRVTPSPKPLPQTGFARLVMYDGAAFDRAEPDGGRLAAGSKTLLRGTIELRFDKGAIVRLTGPTSFELRGPDELCLHRGEVTARVPTPAVGFTVSTPVSRVVDLGTEFDVRVGDSGATEAVVRRGRVLLRAQRAGEQPSRAVELAAGGLDRASVSLPDIAGPVLPVSTTIGDGHGGFLGLISVDGRTMEFRSPEKFREIQASIFKELRESPKTFSQRWSLRVQASGGASASASVEIDGQRQGVSISGDEAAGPPAPAPDPKDGKAIPKPKSEAQQLLREQIDEMRRQNGDDPKMKGILDDMLRKLDDM